MSQVLTVSQLSAELKRHVEARFDNVRVAGELSNFLPHRSGHWYFVLKDAGAVLNCVMFRGNNQQLRWQPQSGDQVIVSGGLDVYAPQGKYNMLVRRMERSGEGDLQRKLEELKRKLKDEGLFEVSRKRRLPELPRAIGVATSPTGAAFQDILKVLSRRFPGLTVYLAPCRVQGDGAAEEIAAAVRLLDRHGGSDVLIVGRGGGSQEDLAAFNEEIVARAVVACRVPVVSAVGHEIDFSICDMVADVRAATPSHAAELVVPEQAGLVALVDERQRQLLAAMKRQLTRKRDLVLRQRQSLRDPRRKVADARIRCDELYDRLVAASKRDLARRRRLVELRQGRLEALSPVAVLSRGYAVAMKDGRAVRSSEELASGDLVELRLHVGVATARVESSSDGI